ncbi:MAG: hypothetical protein ACJ798_15165 [Phenylobacterium sp.]
MTPRQQSILIGARRAGWGLAAAVLACLPLGAMELHQVLERQAARGLAAKIEFLTKVRACLAKPARPRPSWQDCEIRVVQTEKP